jgi:hypothetical protein
MAKIVADRGLKTSGILSSHEMGKLVMKIEDVEKHDEENDGERYEGVRFHI